MIVYFKHITHTIVIIEHYKRTGYVIIPKLNFLSRECINFHCRRFYMLPFCRRYDRSCRRLDCHRFNVLLAINY